MNNLFYAFSIKVPGAVLDDVKFFDYSDYVFDTNVPTEAESTAKAAAYIRMKHLKRKISDYIVPNYETVTFGTAGTCKTVPADAELVFAFHNIDFLLVHVADQSTITPDNRMKKAAEVLKALVDSAFLGDLVEFGEILVSYTRHQNAFSTVDVKYHELKTVYVTSAEAVISSTVVPVELKA